MYKGKTMSKQGFPLFLTILVLLKEARRRGVYIGSYGIYNVISVVALYYTPLLNHMENP